MSAGFIVNQHELLDRIKINYSGGITDVTDTTNAIVVKESFIYDELRCTLVVTDSTGGLDRIDFDGTETFKLSFKSLAEDDEARTINFRIYKIDIAIDPEKSDQKIFTFDATTPEMIKQSTMDINQSFKTAINVAAENIFSKIGSKKKIQTHETTGTYTYIIPGMTPYESMEFLCRRAYDSKYRSSYFMFYENLDGYHFKNLERIIAEERDNAITYKYTPTAGAGDPDPQFSITQLELPTNKDVMEKINSGAYANAVREIDLINQRVNSSSVRVKEDFGTFQHLDRIAMSLDSKAIIDEHLNTINSTTWINNAGVVDKRRELIPRRKFYADCLNQVTATLTVPGNSNLTIGKIIDLDMLEMSGQTEEKGQEPKITGKYLITEIDHIMIGKNYTCKLQVNKESYIGNADNMEDSIVVKQ